MTSIVASIIYVVIIAYIAIIDCVYMIELVFGLFNNKKSEYLAGDNLSIAILMPAHNEQDALSRSENLLKSFQENSVRIVVVADNCTDATAEVAASAGCEVVARRDSALRGKGFALAAGVDHLKYSPPDVVVILDADCEIDMVSLLLIAYRAVDLNRVVQAAYLFRPDMKGPTLIQISNFAFFVKNLVRQRGGARIGAAAILTGSGVAFPWRLISTLDLRTPNIVEDLALGVELVQREEYPYFEEGATVWSEASTLAGTQVQRSRWESGFIKTAALLAVPMVMDGFRRRNFKIFWMGMHLAVPPLSILLALNYLYIIFSLARFYYDHEAIFLVICLILNVGIFISTFLAWAIDGRSYMSGSALLALPHYFLSKMSLYAQLVFRRRSVGWVRTERSRKD